MNHRHEYRVIYGDTDTAGVMYYGTYMRLFEIGRTEFMRSVYNLSYRELEEGGIVLPVVELYARYRSPAKYDDIVVIETCLRGITRATISFQHEIRDAESERLIAEGHTKHAATTHDGRLARMPEALVMAAGSNPAP
jgi:acyl-CoA thioester hydrolase